MYRINYLCSGACTMLLEARRLGLLANDFEGHFRDFVRSLGGAVLPEGNNESADFLFQEDDVVVELKTLEEEARSEYERKLQALAESWMKRGLLIGFGRVQISLPKVPPVCQNESLSDLSSQVTLSQLDFAGTARLICPDAPDNC
jgi:hypothetical protein